MNYLVVWDNLKASISKAHSIIDLRKIRDKAEQYRYAATIAKESKDVIHKATEIRLRAERRMEDYCWMSSDNIEQISTLGLGADSII